jgi:hypothetical protein
MQRLKRLLACFCALGTLTVTASAAPVITWVAPYRIPASKAMLQRDFGGVGMKDGLTWLALQFWITAGPDIVRDGNIPAAEFDTQVKWFRDWGHANGVKVTLCVTNYVGSWNWPEARRSFLDNRSAFVKALVAETDRLGLDGVELDLEGLVEATGADVAGFIALGAELAAALHPKGKVVTVASFAAQWNAPNWKWWPELMKSVDGVTSMGYESAGFASTNGFNYADQKKHALPAGKLMIGMSGFHAVWEGNTLSEQLDWVVKDGEVGVGIWDASLENPAWQAAAVWRKLAKIRSATTASIAPVRVISSGALAPEGDFDTAGRERKESGPLPVFARPR